MRGFRLLGLVLCLAAVIAVNLTSSPAAAGPNVPKWRPAPGEPQASPGKILVRTPGQVFCPSVVLVSGNIVIPSGQCFLLSVLRDKSGTFLAFVPPDTRIPPGQIVRLDTPAGPKRNGRMFLVPLQTNVVLIPVNTVTLVSTRIEDLGPRLAVVLMGTPASNLTVFFNVHSL